MMTPMHTDPSEEAPSPDEINRLWQHGMHEERLFHDRLNYFTGIQVGLAFITWVIVRAWHARKGGRPWQRGVRTPKILAADEERE